MFAPRRPVRRCNGSPICCWDWIQHALPRSIPVAKSQQPPAIETEVTDELDSTRLNNGGAA